MEQKKVSFGFSKIIKKPSLQSSKPKEVELIKCLEGQSIKLIKQEEDEEQKPLVIPMKDNRKTSAALASLRLRQEVLNGNLENTIDVPKEEISHPVSGDQGQSIELRAVQELLKEARGESTEDLKNSNLTLPLKPDDLPLDGATQSTLEDYENIPVSQFGLAMLRGMGWKDEDKDKDQSAKDTEGPILRPKGMGLGADKVLKRKALLVPPEVNEKLEIKKNACVRILGGKYRDMYGQIEGLDDHAGRVIVKLALGGNRESLNEFMVQPVSKREYSEYGKVINSVKYDQYKKLENEYGQIIIKAEDVKKEQETLDEVDRRYRNNEGRKLRQDEQVLGMKFNSETDKFDIKVKSENKERHRAEKTTSSRSSKYPSHTSNERNDSHKESLDHEQVYSRRDQRDSRRQSTSEEESSEGVDYQKLKKKSKKKSKDRHRYRNDSSEDDKRHKKKTKKSKRPRSRSRQRR